MHEWREDPITGRWVMIASQREARPQEFTSAPNRTRMVDCPFCRGHEEQTPPAVLELPDPEVPGRWRVRVTPNKYPALELPDPNADDRRQGSTSAALPPAGAHEVIIESPTHLSSITELSRSHYCDVLAAYRERMLFWKARSTEGAAPVTSVFIFKNSGALAGASLAHLHSQLLAMPAPPPLVAEELAGAARAFGRAHRCVYCELLARESADRTRIVVEGPNFMAFCPYASRFPLETWIVPTAHASHFETSRPALLAELAPLVQQLVGRLEQFVEGLAYNYWIHSAPLDALESESYHWHIEIAPRMTTMAGLELGGGWHINTIAPEDAAARLRAM